MQDLRLVGVHESGEHLLLSGTGGETFRLRLDEALRVAVTRSVHRSTAAAKRPQGPAMSPRDIQARIRSGASVEDVAEVSGLDLAHIRRYEGPVRAERDYVAGQARAVEVAAPLSATNDGYRSTFGDSPVNLGDMVSHRLKAFGVDPDSVQWDAWRRPDSTWDVVARFDLGTDSQVSVGEEPPARWIFSPLRKSITNANRWAQLLSELEPLDSPVPSGRLTAVADRVFDFEAVAPETDGEPENGGEDTENLLEVLRSRRGQRLGTDEDGDDALAALLAKGSGAAAQTPAGQDEPEDTGSPRPRTGGHLTLAPVESDTGTGSTAAADALRRPGDISTNTPKISTLSRSPRRSSGAADSTGKAPVAAKAPVTKAAARKAPVPAKESGSTAESVLAPAKDDTAAPDTGTGAGGRSKAKPAAKKGGRTDFPWDRMGSGGNRGEAAGTADTGAAKGEDDPDRRPLKAKRSSVPSWDDIVFGTKGD